MSAQRRPKPRPKPLGDIRLLISPRIVGTCRSGKQRYPSEWEANIALTVIRAKRRKHNAPEENIEKRIYPCPMCRGWHTTHLEAFPEGR